MDEQVHLIDEASRTPSDYDYDYWRWWYNVLGMATVLGIAVLISLW
jgi:hypothetical protein